MHALVGARDDITDDIAVRLSQLIHLIDLTHSEHAHFLPEAARIPFFGKHGELDVRINTVFLVVPHVAELTAYVVYGAADRLVDFDGQYVRFHGSLPAKLIAVR